MSAKHSAIGSHIRQLCSIGLPAGIVIPQVIEAIRQMVGADWGMFIFADEQGNATDIYSQRTDLYALLPEFYLLRERSPEKDLLGIDFAGAMARGYGWKNSAPADSRIVSSGMYYELWRPVEMRHSIEATVIAHPKARGCGCIQLSRSRHIRRFSDRDQASVAAYGRYIAHALQSPFIQARQFSTTSDSSMLIVDAKGNVVLSDAFAQRMVALADQQSLIRRYRNPSRLPEWLEPILRRLSLIFEEQAALPPCIERVNGSGRFLFRAYRLQDVHSEGDVHLCAINIQHFLPAPLAVEVQGFGMGLSEQQRKVSEAIVNGLSYPEIARRLSIRQSTVVDHVRKICDKLDVRSRGELKKKMLESTTDLQSRHLQ